MLRNRVVLFIVILTAVAVSCSKPSTHEEFVRSGEAISGRYCFEMDMTDSLALYDVWICTRIDRRMSLVAGRYSPLELNIWWVSPTGKTYDERVYMDGGDTRGAKQLYRKDVVPSEDGIWKMWIEPCNPPDQLRGMGVIFERHGSR